MAIIEMRTYRLNPGSISQAVGRVGAAVQSSGRSKVSPLGGFFHTEVGPLNRIIHCWPYESLDAREKLRAEAMKLQGWPPPIGEFIEEMEAKIINLAPFSPALGERGICNIYEFRTYT